jgi:sugar/nucleoside kinase (ribokinase family)
MVVFGGTALVPGLHDHLTNLLKRSKEAGCITVVNTVYDFRNEMTHPGKPWPLGHSGDSFSHMDLLLMDYEEAVHISGMDDIEGACAFFINQGVSSFVITNGTENTCCYADGNLFKPLPLGSFPISGDLINDLKNHRGGDTTGCGDNFVGGMLASLARQLQEGKGKPDLVEAISWGTVSGGYCCFHLGGTLLESEPGEKRKMIHPYYLRYKEQIHG